MPAKIQLSPEELDLVKNREWIIRKHVITKKVYDMFGELSEIFKKEVSVLEHLFPENIKYQNGKISKGENYQLLPYIILDYPAFFWKDRVMAIRTMFWWGNFFSVTLHLSGIYQKQFTTDIEGLFYILRKNNFFICVNGDEWQHHFELDNYKAISSITLQEFEILNQNNFFKISKKISLTEWDKASGFILETFREIMELLRVSYQGGKKDL